MRELAITGTASTAPTTIEFNFAAAEINFINDGANSIYVSFIDPTIANGLEVKNGESRSWSDRLNASDRLRLYVKTATSTSAFHGDAIR